MSRSYESRGSFFQESLQPFQIVYLKHELKRLYAEVVQAVETKKICWVRPLALAELEGELGLFANSDLAIPRFYDLRQGSDLLLPTQLLHIALDTEAIPLLTELAVLESDRTYEDSPSQQISRFELTQFIEKVCLAHPEAFSLKQPE